MKLIFFGVFLGLAVGLPTWAAPRSVLLTLEVPQARQLWVVDNRNGMVCVFSLQPHPVLLVRRIAATGEVHALRLGPDGASVTLETVAGVHAWRLARVAGGEGVAIQKTPALQAAGVGLGGGQ